MKSSPAVRPRTRRGRAAELVRFMPKRLVLLLAVWLAASAPDVAAQGVAEPDRVALGAFVRGGEIEASAFAEAVVQRCVPSAEPQCLEAVLPERTAGAAEAQDLWQAVVLLQAAVRGMPAASCGSAGLDPLSTSADSAAVASCRRAETLRQSDAVLRHGTLAVLAAEGEAVAFERVLDGDRRVVAFNRGDQPAFLALPGEGVPPPLVPAAVSRDAAGRVPSLVAVLDDAVGGVLYGLRVPARTTVVYRPAAPSDVRPRGLDE